MKGPDRHIGLANRKTERFGFDLLRSAILGVQPRVLIFLRPLFDETERPLLLLNYNVSTVTQFVF